MSDRMDRDKLEKILAKRAEEWAVDITEQSENSLSPRSISLKVSLKFYNKEDLRWYARTLQLRRYSSLSKDELAEKIANELLLPSVMKKRLGILSDEQMQLFEAALKPDFFPEDEQMDDADFLQELDYAYFSRRDTLVVPCDVAERYAQISTPQFHEKRKQKAWLLACLKTIPVFYCVAPVSVLHRMFRKKAGCRIAREELLELLAEIPDDLNPCFMQGDELIAVNALQEGIYRNVQETQRDKDFYIPTYEEVMDLTHNGYLSQEPAYVKLKQFFMKEMEMDDDDAGDMAGEIWKRVNLGDDIHGIMDWLNEMNFDFSSEGSLESFVSLYQDAHNNTRMLSNRGYKPIELWQKERPGMPWRMPMVVPGSSQAENVVKKVYSNDPCPCGSGKKYKKCCGRK